MEFDLLFSLARKARVSAASVAFLLLSTHQSSAQVPIPYGDLHDFGAQITDASGKMAPDGIGPNEVIRDSAGNLFGCTNAGGPTDQGMVWEITAAGVYKDLHDFGGTIKLSNGTTGVDGEEPAAGVTVDTAGNIYGTTVFGGGYFYGMVWEISKAGVYTDLHDFGGKVTYPNGSSGLDGERPYDSPALDTNGNIYGTAEEGGPNNGGVLWKISKAGVYQDLHNFGGTIVDAHGATGPDGDNPFESVAVDSAGNVFGVVQNGSLDGGMVFRVSSTGVYKDLHDFGELITNSKGQKAYEGCLPMCHVVLDSVGNVYGTTYYNSPGPTNVWEIKTTGAYVDLFDFSSSATVTYPDGTTGPMATNATGEIAIDSLGNIFGTSSSGGEYTYGNVWEVTKGGLYIDLHEFGGAITYADGTKGPDPQNCYGGVFMDSSGPIYGTTLNEGEYATSSNKVGGNVWTLIPILGLSLTETVLGGGAHTTATVSLGRPAPAGGAKVDLSSNSADATVQSSITIPAGSASASFNISSKPVSASTHVTITAQAGPSVKSANLTIVPVAISSLKISPSAVVAGMSATGTVTLNGPAPKGGLEVTFGTSNSKVAAGPSSLMIAAGSSSATFAVKTYPVTTAETVTIRAVLGSSSESTTVTVNP
jgi:hypothetical protein